MPQLDPEFFLSQLFWFVVTFSFLLIFLWRISLPRISSILEKREYKINNDIQSAKKLQTEAENIQSQIEDQLVIAHNQATEMIKKASIKLQNNASNEIKKVNSELSTKIDESAKIIQKNKDASLIKLKDQIQEITKLTLLKLSKIQTTDQEIKSVISTIQSETESKNV